jgi:hypothetical protein
MKSNDAAIQDQAFWAIANALAQEQVDDDCN